MYYASFGVLSIIIHLITNHEYIWGKRDEAVSFTAKRYRSFLIGVMIYYVSDVLWGTLYEWRIVPLVYADTVMYFFSMVLSVLLWTRVVVAYLDSKGLFGRFLKCAGWAIFLSEVLLLIINAFYPIIFSFNDNKEYVPGQVRYITLAMQVVLFFLASIYTLLAAAKASGKARIRNKTVGISGIVISVFIVLQTLYPLLPFYAIGLMIGTCLIHTFVEEDMKLERAIELGKVQKKAEYELQEKIKARKKNITFNRIAESLASNYDVIYYVDTRDNSYVGYSSNYALGQLEALREGDDFFSDAKKDLGVNTYPKDRERVLTFFDRDFLFEALKKRKQFSSDYRMMVEGEPLYYRIVVRKSSSGEHFIIAIENVDDELRREKEQQLALEAEKELARHDELTGTKNKTAYMELEQSIQETIDAGRPQAFGIAVCDINDLKKTNDTWGHQAGDDLIRAASKLLCNTFVHSPVFRIGGDEFAIYLSGDDYAAREELAGRLRVRTFENLLKKDGPVIAFGMASYEEGRDRQVSDVFKRADNMMYINKRELKEQ